MCVPARAEPPLVSVEARVGAGVSAGDGVLRRSPLVASALVDVAVRELPRASLFAGTYIETDRAAVGVLGGARLFPGAGLRLGGGLAGTFAPYRVFGLLAEAGWCLPGPAVTPCLDLQGTAYVQGNDLPEQRVALLALAILGLSFRAL